MIVKASEADRYAAQPRSDWIAVLVYGPDSGLVRERAEKLAKTVVRDLNDAFHVSELDDAALHADPARLADEAAAISMLGGRRVVRVRGAGNTLAKLFEGFLSNPKGDALIVVEGGDLARGTALRKLFEEAGNAAAIACYADNARDLAGVVRDAMKAEGLTIAADAVEQAVGRLGSDRGITRRELEKLALYARDSGRVTAEDVRAAMGDEAEARSEAVCDAAGEGQWERLDQELSRLWAEDTSPIALVRAALGHFQRLAIVKAQVARGEAADGTMKKLRPPVHFSREAAFRAQLSRWSEPRLEAALDLLLETEALCKTTGIPGEAVCGRALFNIASMVRPR